MRKSEFIENAKLLNNFELYNKLKSIFINSAVNNSEPGIIDNIYIDEGNSRDTNFVKYAYNDAGSVISSLLSANSLKITDYIDISNFKNNEINDLINNSDYFERYNKFDLISALDLNNNSLVICKVEGESMQEADIKDGDIVFADKSITPQSGDIIIASVNNTLYIKKYLLLNNSIYLVSENRNFPPVLIEKGMQFEIIGVVEKIMHNIR